MIGIWLQTDSFIKYNFEIIENYKGEKGRMTIRKVKKIFIFFSIILYAMNPLKVYAVDADTIKVEQFF